MMAFEASPAYAESDADDEYERSIGALSPVGDNITDSEHSHSPIDSEISVSTIENTPTTYGHRPGADRLPETIIMEWTAEECADFIGSIGLGQYGDLFVENEIVGEALVALQHEDLKSMGIASVGHRLTILKSVYDVKKAQDIPVESDHYQPLSADAEAQYATATLKDIKRLVEQLRLRDERIYLMEGDMRRMMEDFRKLREDVLPALRLAKDANHPLPNVSTSSQGYSFDSLASPQTATTPQSATSSTAPPPGIKRQYSQRKILIGAAPKSSSPTQTTHERSIAEQSLDPSNAAERAVLSSTHLAAMNGQGGSSGHPSPNIPSPTSPHNHSLQATLASRSYRGDSSARPEADPHSSYSSRDKAVGASGSSSRSRRDPVGPDAPGGSASASSVEIFKSFRVSMDDPCHKVLPAALKKYQINAPWDQYALYIVYGDQERCLGMDEKPLILFKQLDKEGKKPMFMLRKTTAAQSEPDAGTRGPSYDPPGGII